LEKMASQYNYYQYQTQAQRQQQQTAAAGTGAMEWNGTAWVPAGGAATAATQQPQVAHPAGAAATATSAAAVGEAPPQQPEVPPGHALPPPSSTPQQCVAAYSAIYQEWKAQGSQQSQLAATLPAGPRREEAGSRAQWAEYYAELSSRCAHYYNTLLSRGVAAQQQSYQQQQQQQQQQQAYQHQQQSYQHQQQYGQYQAQQQQSRWGQAPAPAPAPAPAATAAAAPPPPPESMKRYVHRCLARCATADQKERVQAKVESLISQHIRNGTLQTTDWDTLECVAPEEPQQQQQQQQNQQQYQHHHHQQRYGSPPPHKKQRSSGNDHYYGHTSGGGGGSNTYGGGGGGGGGYYGPSSSFGHDQSDFIAFDSGSSPAKGKRGGNKKKKGKQSKSKSSDAGHYAPQQDDGFERSDATLNARQARFSGQGGLSDTAKHSSPAKPGAINNVERYMGKTVIGGTRKLNEEDFEAMTVKGMCTVLEKAYLRLTAPPKAELVRPEPILKEHLTNLKKLWLKPEKERGGGGKRDYAWFCSQFKAIRQDLTVQRIFNAFAVHTYETHARIALEEGDLNEFNQCQTQLKELYEKLAHDQSEKSGLKNETEFIAYRILYYVILSGNKKYEGGSSDMMKILLSLSSERRADPTISHALKVRVAVAEYDYHAFFTLQDNCPNMGAYLMDYLVPSVRRDSLQRIHKAFRPNVPVDHVLSELGFDTTDDEDSEEGTTWLRSCGCKLSDDGKLFLTKDSVLKESDLTSKKSSLI